MRKMTFALRTHKELTRDPLNYAFSLGFPVVVMLLLSAIQRNIPIPLFEIRSLTPGMAIFGLSFVSLFSGMLIAKDRSTSFLTRLYASPMTSADFIIGYSLPLIPLCVLQNLCCFFVAWILGLKLDGRVAMALLTLLPSGLLYIGIGLLAGSAFNDKQVGGVCGALLTNLTAWLSGAWFDLQLVGGGLYRVAMALPFLRAVEATRAALSGNYAQIMPHLWWVIGYALVIDALAIFVFRLKMKKDAG